MLNIIDILTPNAADKLYLKDIDVISNRKTLTTQLEFHKHQQELMKQNQRILAALASRNADQALAPLNFKDKSVYEINSSPADSSSVHGTEHGGSGLQEQHESPGNEDKKSKDEILDARLNTADASEKGAATRRVSTVSENSNQISDVPVSPSFSAIGNNAKSTFQVEADEANYSNAKEAESELQKQIRAQAQLQAQLQINAQLQAQVLQSQGVFKRTNTAGSNASSKNSTSQLKQNSSLNSMLNVTKSNMLAANSFSNPNGDVNTNLNAVANFSLAGQGPAAAPSVSLSPNDPSSLYSSVNGYGYPNNLIDTSSIYSANGLSAHAQDLSALSASRLHDSGVSSLLGGRGGINHANTPVPGMGLGVLGAGGGTQHLSQQHVGAANNDHAILQGLHQSYNPYQHMAPGTAAQQQLAPSRANELNDLLFYSQQKQQQQQQQHADLMESLVLRDRKRQHSEVNNLLAHNHLSKRHRSSFETSPNNMANLLSNDLHANSLLQQHGGGVGGDNKASIIDYITRQRFLSQAAHQDENALIDAQMERLLLAQQQQQQQQQLQNSAHLLQSQHQRSNLLDTSMSSAYNIHGMLNPDLQQQQFRLPSQYNPPFCMPAISNSSLNNDNDDSLELAVPKQHFSLRPYMHLGTETDEIWLSRFLTFLRSECIEVFIATRTDVFERKTSKKIQVNQVGLRCRFCAHLPYRARVVRSSCFPSSICRIYQSLTMMIREHFSRCHEMPDKTREKYTELKWMTKKGEIESKSHWIESAKAIGMVDTEKGIFLNKPIELTYPSAEPSDSSSSRTSSPPTKQSKSKSS